jgi:sugar/nucleoside kinase (ribokinase family)
MRTAKNGGKIIVKSIDSTGAGDAFVGATIY